jgi:hypothetical protein
MDPLLRRALAATAAMNIVGSLAFTPFGAGLRTFVGLPDAHPLWPLSVGTFILAMGFGYAALAITGRPERVFLGVAAAGKASFALLLLAMGAAGEIPALAAAAGLPDLAFAAIFARWLWRTRTSEAERAER